MGVVTSTGEWPGSGDPLDAQLTVFGECAELPGGVDGCPPLLWLPDRGPGADRLGRTATLLTDLPVELGPHGWKLADHPGADLRRATGLLRDDVSALAVAASGYVGPLTLSVLGPWTMAAKLYLARGDVVLSDKGAVRELGESLATGIAAHVAEVRRQVPGAEIVVQLDERLVGQVLLGVIPTFSGYARISAVPSPEVIEGLEPVMAAIHAAGASSVVQASTGPGVVVAALAGAGGFGLSVSGWDELRWATAARAVERGMTLWAGLPIGAEPRDPVDLADAVSTPWRRIGLPVRGLADVRLFDLGRAPSPARARAGLSELGRAAEILGERADR